MFPLLNEYLTCVDVNDKELLNNINQHFKEFANNFDHYFPEHEDPRNGNLWINNPFKENVNHATLISMKKKV